MVALLRLPCTTINIVVTINHLVSPTGGIILFCYIQEVKLKRDIGCATSKSIEVTESKWTIGNESKTSYGYRYSDDKFDRPVRKAYKISIHESYRDKNIKSGNNVKKKQFHICNMGYYDFVDFSFFDCHMESRIDEIAEQLNTTSKHLYDLIYEKIDPLQNRITDEFSITDEEIERLRQKEIISQYQKNKAEFSAKYEVDQKEYDYCYDVFGKLRNPRYKDILIRGAEWTKEFNKKNEEEYSRYYKNNSGNYNNYSNLFGNAMSFSEENKGVLKQFYRLLSKKFHPDANPDKDTSEEMKLINQLKTQWGV